jgi:hypothetical protein
MQKQIQNLSIDLRVICLSHVFFFCIIFQIYDLCESNLPLLKISAVSWISQEAKTCGRDRGALFLDLMHNIAKENGKKMRKCLEREGVMRGDKKYVEGGIMYE